MPKFLSIGSTSVVKYGKGENIVVGFHGWAGSYTDFEVFGKWLDGSKYTLYVIEFPGRGGSDVLDYHTIDDLVHHIHRNIKHLGIKNFTFVSDCGFSQVSIKYAYIYPKEVKSMFLIYTPLLVPRIFKLRKFFYPIIYTFAKTRRLDKVMDKIRNNKNLMHKLFVDGNPPESQQLALIDIANKQKANLRAIFESAWSIITTNVVREWESLTCHIEVLVAEKDELTNTKLGLKYLKRNPNAHITVMKNHKHHWDNVFIEEMRNLFVKTVRE